MKHLKLSFLLSVFVMGGGWGYAEYRLHRCHELLAQVPPLLDEMIRRLDKCSGTEGARQ